MSAVRVSPPPAARSPDQEAADRRLLRGARNLVRRACLTRPALGAAAPLLARRRGRAACLLYHRVHLPGGGAASWGNAVLSVPADDFDRQMEWLSRHRTCLSIAEAISLLLAGRLPEGAAIVTFDDGYRDNLELALPILERHGVPATVFIATGLLDAPGEPWWQELERLLARLPAFTVELGGEPERWRLRSSAARRRAFARIAGWARSSSAQAVSAVLQQLREQSPEPAGELAPNPMLSWEEAARLASHPLVTIGAHTVSHPSLAALPVEEAGWEIVESKRVLALRTGARVEHFAYPYGGRHQCGARESRLVAAAGFRSAFTTLEGPLFAEDAHNPHLLPRIPILDRDGLTGLRFRLSGWPALLRAGGGAGVRHE